MAAATHIGHDAQSMGGALSAEQQLYKNKDY